MSIFMTDQIQRTQNWKTMVYAFFIGTLFIFGIPGSAVQGQMTEAAETTSDSEMSEIDRLLQQADIYVQQQEFAAGYDLYLRVLGIEPTNLHAREKIFEVINTYKTQLDTAQKQEDVEQVKLYYQRYRNSVRDFLQMLTTQLKRGIQKYGELVAAEKAGQNVTQEIVPSLQTVIQILEDLKIIYQEFPQAEEDAANTQKIVERLNQTIQKYEQELSQYQE
jgi:hypothetical protein